MCEAKPGPRCVPHARVEAIRTMQTLQTDVATTPRERARKAVAEAMVPRGKSPQWAAYYAATDRKHLDSTTGGSTFTDPRLRRLEDVIELAILQRGSVAGDDRDALIAAGALPDAFRDDTRYLLVRTAGTLGAVRANTLPPATPVEIVRDKEGVPAAVVTDVTHQPTTSIATVIVVTDEDTGHPMVITAFPGYPEPPREPSPLDNMAGWHMTLAEASAIIGHDQYAVMTRRV